MSWLDRILGKSKSNQTSKMSTSNENILTKRRKKGLNYRSLSLEPLESRELLAVTPADFDAIKALYPGLDLREFGNYTYTDIGGDDEDNDPVFGVGELQNAINNPVGFPARPHIIVVRTTAEDNSMFVTSPLTITNSNIFIVSLGTHSLLLSGSGSSQILTVSSGATNINIAGVDFTDALGANGGAINNAGSLLLESCTVTNCSAAQGGGVYNTGALNLKDMAFSNNIATANGGAIYNAGRLTVEGTIRDEVFWNANNFLITNSPVIPMTDSNGYLNTGSLFRDNSAIQGGAIYNTGTLRTIYTNYGYNYTNGGVGGAIYNALGATADVDICVFNSNGYYRRLGSNYEWVITLETASGGAAYNAGILNINGSTLRDNHSNNQGNVFYSEASGTISVDDYYEHDSNGEVILTIHTLIEDNSGRIGVNGGAIYHTGGILTLRGATFRGYRVAGQGGAIYISAGTVNLVGCTLSNNTAGISGGAVYVAATGTLIATNSTIRGNQATNGGGIYNASGILTITNTDIDGNIATTNGGGVYTTGTTAGRVNFTDSRITNNIAGTNGGGIYSTGYVTLTGSQGLPMRIDGNRATRGGGIWQQGSTLNANGVVSITENQATIEGGGIYVNSSSANTTLNFNSSISNGIVIGHNTASSNGGGIYANTSITGLGGSRTTNFNFTNVSVTGNGANYGGGIYNYTDIGGTLILPSASLNMNFSGGGVRITENTATYDGGGLFNDFNVNSGFGLFGGYSWSLNGTRNANGVSTVLFEGNIAGRNGGGLCSSSLISGITVFPSSTLNITGVDFRKNTANGQANINTNDFATSTANGGGGIYQPGGTLTLNNVFLDGNMAPNGVGGGIMVMPAFGGLLSTTGTVNINNDTRIRDNIALCGGGIATASTLNVNTNSKITGNQAVRILGNSQIAGLGGGIFSLVATNINTGAGNANSTVLIENNIAKACYRIQGGLAFVTDRADVLAGLLEALGDGNVNLDTFMQSIGVGGGIFQFGSTLTVGGTGANRRTYIDGNAADAGGGIAMTGTLNMVGNVWMRENEAVFGGGIFSTGTSTINNSHFVGNVAALHLMPIVARGGAFYLDGSSTTITNSQFWGNASQGMGGNFYTNGTTTDLTLVSCYVGGGQNGWSGSTALLGGGIYHEGRQLNLRNSVFENLTATNSGGALYVASTTTTTVDGCQFTGNSTDNQSGGAVYYTNGTLNISNSHFLGNSTKSSAANGGAFFMANGMLNISTSVLSGNTTSNHGGAIYANARVSINDSTVSDNVARKNGGAFFVSGNNSELKINNTDLLGNSALEYGGAVYLKDSKGKPSIAGSRMENNYALGGAAVWMDGSTLDMSNVAFLANEASNGGAIELRGGELVIINGSFVRNKVAHEGGALLQWGGQLTLVNCVIADNTADFGAGMYQLGGRLELANCTIAYNTARFGSGGIHLDGVSQLINNTIIANNSGVLAGDIYHYSGQLAGKNNLIGAEEGAGQTVFQDGKNGNIVGFDPLFAELVATQSGGYAYPLQEASLARGKGSYQLVHDGIETDIFGNRYYASNVDIGAVQMQDMPGRSSVTYRVKSVAEFWDALNSANLNVSVNGQQPGSFVEKDRIVFDTDYFDVNAPVYLGLNGTTLEFLGSVEIDTNGIEVIFDGMGLSQVIHVKAGIDVTLIGVSITGGLAIEGGGVYNDGLLTLIDCLLYDNSAYSGGGIYNNGGTLNLIGTTLEMNTAKFKDDEKAVGDVYQYVFGGGLYQAGGVVTITECRFGYNTSDGFGGAVYQENGQLSIGETVLLGNHAVRGGAVYFTGSGSSLVIEASSITDNMAQYGGGIWQSGGDARNGGGLEIVNSTIAENRALLYQAGGFGGGIYQVSGDLGLKNVTIVHNSVSQEGGGIYLRGGNLLLENTIVAQNKKISLNPVINGRNSDIQYYSGKILSESKSNFIGDGTGQSSLVEGWNGNQVGTLTRPIDPKLGARVIDPMFPEGFTYYVPQKNSPLIDAGNDDVVVNIPLDQRRESRKVGSHVDIGAVEYAWIDPNITDAEYEQLRAMYPGLNLAASKTAYNVIPIAASDISAQTLRDAIAQAAESSENDLIVLRTSIETQNLIFLGGSELLIDIDAGLFGSVTIVVLGSVPVTIDGQGRSRIFNVSGGVDNLSSPELGLGGLVLTNGFSTGFGGAIYETTGSVIVSNCLIENNNAENGGAIAVQNANLTVTDETRLWNNTASSRGGALYTSGRATNWVIESSSVRGNTAGFYGGGVYQNGAESGIIMASTIAENRAQNGAGVYLYSGPLDVISSTITRNGINAGVAEAVYGGGIYQENGTLNLYSNTIVNNMAIRDGGGVYKQAGTLNVYNSILSYNTANTGANIYGSMAASSSNLINYAGTPFLGGAMELNGQIYYPLLNQAGSPAIDLGNNTYARGVDDQIGNSRIANGRIDIGSIEYISLTEAEYKNIIGQYNGLELSQDMRDYNIILLTGSLVSDQGLREAIVTAGETVKKDLIIVFNTTASIVLTGGELDVDIDSSLKGSITIIAANVQIPLVIEADADSRVFNIDGGTTHVGLGGITITGGNIAGKTGEEGYGGGIRVENGVLRLNTVTFENNYADQGGGLWLKDGSVYACEGTIFTENYADYGGGVAVSGGELLFDNEVFLENNQAYENGGGLFLNGGKALLNGVIVEQNIAENGGGIWAEQGIVELMNGTRIVNNMAAIVGGGVYQESGALTVQQSVIARNLAPMGAGYYQNGGLSSLSASSVYDNIAEEGGGIFLDGGEMKIANSTISRNTAEYGGAIYLNVGDVQLNNVTVSENAASEYGGGLYQTDGKLTIYNSIVAGNTAVLGGSDMYYVSGGMLGEYNVIGDGSDQPALIDGIDGNQAGSTAEPLEDILDGRVNLPNGQVYYPLLSANSVAVDAGSLDYKVGDKDQLGNQRVYNDRIDVGAIESLFRSTRVFLGASVLSAGEVQLTWSPVKDAQVYDVQHFNPQTLRWESLGKTSETSYTDFSAQSGQMHHYRIVARNQNNEQFVATSVVSVTLDSEEMDLNVQTQILIRDIKTSKTDSFDMALAAQQTWVNEWSQFWVEIWAKPENGEFIADFNNCRFDYDASLFAVNAIEFGPGYEGTGDISTRGVVSLSGTSNGTEQGEWVLLARVSFKAAPVGASTQSIASIPNGIPNGVAFASSMEIATQSQSGQRTNSTAKLSLTELPVYPVIYDFTGDGKINASDFILFAQVYGKTNVADTEWAKFDLNGDGKINASDFLLFAQSYGKTRESGLSNNALPYPRIPVNNNAANNNSMVAAGITIISSDTVLEVLETSPVATLEEIVGSVSNAAGIFDLTPVISRPDALGPNVGEWGFIEVSGQNLAELDYLGLAGTVRSGQNDIADISAHVFEEFYKESLPIHEAPSIDWQAYENGLGELLETIF